MDRGMSIATNMDKERTKHYHRMMRDAGFRQITLWVHRDDEESVRRTAERAREDMRVAKIRAEIAAMAIRKLTNGEAK